MSQESQKPLVAVIVGPTASGKTSASIELAKVLDGEIVSADSSGIFGYVPNKMYRMKMIQDKHIEFDESFSAQEDLRFALMSYRYIKWCKCIKEPGYLYYRH